MSAALAEAQADARDIADMASLKVLGEIVLAAHRSASRVPPLRHHDRRWDLRDLLDALSNALTDIEAEAERIRDAPVVLEPEDRL
jgi:hypothetical protein